MEAPKDKNGTEYELCPQNAKIGDIVLYQRFGSPGGEHKAEPSPAIVVTAAKDGDTEGRVQLFVMNPNGLYFNNTPYSATPKPGHWYFKT